MLVAMETAPRRDLVCCWRHARASSANRGAHFGVLGVVGDVGHLGMACHGYGSSQGVPTPIQCQMSDTDLKFLCS
jgi:hypothetical protein